jgi:hypothetical protein
MHWRCDVEIQIMDSQAVELRRLREENEALRDRVADGRKEIDRLNTVRIPELMNHGSELLERARTAESKVWGQQYAIEVLADALGDREKRIEALTKQTWDLGSRGDELYEIAQELLLACDEGGYISPKLRAEVRDVFERARIKPDTIPSPPSEPDIEPSVGDEVGT